MNISLKVGQTYHIGRRKRRRVKLQAIVGDWVFIKGYFGGMQGMRINEFIREVGKA